VSKTRALAAAVLLASLAACATQAPPAVDASRIPASLQAGPGQQLDEVLTARGQSVYECRRDGAVQLWFPEGELATLVDTARRSVGTVTPGGYFVAYDDSHVATRRDAVSQMTAGTLVWARLAAKNPPGRSATARMTQGRFARTSVIARIDTTGGLPPDALCEREGGALFVPFSATYLFYSAAAQPSPRSGHPDGALTKSSHDSQLK